MIARDLRQLEAAAVADSDFSHRLCGVKYRTLHHT